MRVMRSLGLSVGLLLLPIIAGAQAPPAPTGAPMPGPPAPRAPIQPRDGAAAQIPTGTGRIRGRVVAADTGVPLRRAQVRISATELRVNRSATTDLPPGNYVAAAVESLEQGGHWDPAFRKHIEPTARRFRLTEGQTANIDLPLTP